jgi:hypothetical protein
VLVLSVVNLLPDFSKNSRNPFSTGGTLLSEKLSVGDSLGVKDNTSVLGVSGNTLKRLEKDVEDGRFTTSSRSNHHDSVTHKRGFIELNNLESPLRDHLEVHVGTQDLHLLNDGIVSLGGHVLLSGEDIINELTEQRNILSNELRHVHISEGTGNDHLLISSFLLSTFVSTGGSEYGKNVSETEIIMTGLGKLHLTKFVQDIELNGEGLVVGVSHGGQLDLHDNLSIGQHHSHTTEEHFKVLGEFLTSSISGVHGDEVSDVKLEDNHTVVRELEHLLLELLTEGDGFDLGGDDGKGGKRNSVEFIEASPHTGGT